MPHRRCTFALALASALPPVAAGAQEPPRGAEGSQSRPRGHGLEVWAGLARRSPRWGVLGDTPGMSLALAAVRWTRPLRVRRGTTLEYAADLIPVALLSPPYLGSADAQRPARPCRPTEPCPYAALGGPFPAGSAFGAGASPLGLTATFRAGRRVQPTVGATGGVLWFDRRVPTTSAARVNFTATLEAGVRVVPARAGGVVLLYRFHHLSNGGTAPDNFAVASHVLSAGYRWQLP